MILDPRRESDPDEVRRRMEEEAWEEAWSENERADRLDDYTPVNNQKGLNAHLSPG